MLGRNLNNDVFIIPRIQHFNVFHSIGDRPTGLYYYFCLSSLLICITEVVIGDRPTFIVV